MPLPKKRAPRKGAASKRPPTLSEDFVALLGEFESARVEYVIVGQPFGVLGEWLPM